MGKFAARLEEASVGKASVVLVPYDEISMQEFSERLRKPDMQLG